jgi:hypothetical protein
MEGREMIKIMRIMKPYSSSQMINQGTDLRPTRLNTGHRRMLRELEDSQTIKDTKVQTTKEVRTSELSFLRE